MYSILLNNTNSAKYTAQYFIYLIFMITNDQYLFNWCHLNQQGMYYVCSLCRSPLQQRLNRWSHRIFWCLWHVNSVGVWLDVDLKGSTNTVVFSCHLVIVAEGCSSDVLIDALGIIKQLHCTICQVSHNYSIFGMHRIQKKQDQLIRPIIQGLRSIHDHYVKNAKSWYNTTMDRLALQSPIL